MFEYVARPGGRFVESIWFARGRMAEPRERIAPTGSTVAAFVLGDPIRQRSLTGDADLVARTGFLIGPHDRPIINEPRGETYCVGIVTTPLGCRPVLGLAPAGLRGRIVDLLTAWLRAADLRRELLDCGTAAAALDLVEDALRTVEPFDRTGIGRCEEAVRSLAAEPGRPIAEISAALGLSHGHLDRLFTEHVGLSPRTLARILRVRRLLAAIDVHGTVGWAGRASEFGWFDQAHLIRDFKRHVGVTPSEYVAAQRSVYGPAEARGAAGFVPEVPSSSGEVKFVQSPVGAVVQRGRNDRGVHRRDDHRPSG